MKKLIVGNLKMNMENVSQRDAYCKDILEEFSSIKTKHEIVVCPPIIYTEYFCRVLQKSGIVVGAQDCFWELYGSYTGNTSPKSIRSLGGQYVIIGHSERRDYNHESDEDVLRKTMMALRSELVPIVCTGFLSHEDEMQSVQSQIDILVQNFEWEEMQSVIIAYEPVWAIGSGKIPTSDDIHTMVMYIRSIIAHKFGNKKSLEIPVLYGGSVNAENIKETCVDAYADGVLVGGASLAPVKFANIVRNLY
ncbi:MAG: triose-phosphate isomerase [Candidatus Moraniibacteriota bacterium]|nr:MAG: triose-phosphate isomerase [Candidatus Moranbacteria bacterium]